MKNKLLVILVMLIGILIGTISLTNAATTRCQRCGASATISYSSNGGTHSRWYNCSSCGASTSMSSEGCSSNGYWYGGGSSRHYTKCSKCGGSYNYGTCSFSLSCPTCGASGARCSTCYTMNPSHTCQTHSHSYSSSVTKSPTCTSTGVRTYTCSCGDSYTESIPITSHSYSVSSSTSATCTSGGSTTYKCSNCGDTYSTSTSSLGHSYTGRYTTTPTCTTAGVIKYTCSRCSDSYSVNVGTSDHSYSSTVTKSPTCYSTGTRKYTCSYCGDSYTESIAKTSHTTPSTWNKIDSSTHYKLCTVCSTTLSSAAHYDNNSDGACDACGYVNDTVPPEASVSAVNNKNSVTITGTATDDKGMIAYAWTTSSDEPTVWTSITKTTSLTQTLEVTSSGTHYFWVRDAGALTDSATVTVYEVAYRVNGGDTVPSNHYKVAGTSITLDTTKAIRAGYTFLNYNTAADGSGTTYNPGDTYSADSNVTLYAQWKLNTFTSSLSQTEYTYDATSKTPIVTVKDGDKSLTEGTDYTVTMTGDKKNVGTVSIIVKGINDYCWIEELRSYTIKQKNIADLTYEMSNEEYYNGLSLTPALTIKYGSLILVKDRDYTFEYSNNTDIGTANVSVVGKGNYTGTKELTFEIVRDPDSTDYIYLDLTPPTISNITTEVGETVVISATIEDPNLVTGEPGSGVKTSATKYMITANNVAPDANDSNWQESNSVSTTLETSGYVWIKAEDNVGNVNMQSVFVEFAISLNSSQITASLNETEYTYDGTEKTPTVIIKDTAKNYDLVLDTDYTVKYDNNINAGKATVTVTGKGKYKDAITLEFTINKATPVINVVDTGVKVDEEVEVAFTSTGNGKVSVTSSGTDIATAELVSEANKTIRIRGIKPGSAVVTISVEATENYADTRISFVVTVIDVEIEITSNPVDVAVKHEASNVTFTVEATGTGIIYQWYKAEAIGSGTAIEEATSASYTIPAASVTKDLDGTYYFCKVTNSAGSVNSNRALLTVYYEPEIITEPADQEAIALQQATFSVIAEAGNPTETTYMWQVSKDNGNTWTDIDGATNSSYTIETIKVSMNGYKYRVLIGNSQYTANERVASKIATLTVNALIIVKPKDEPGGDIPEISEPIDGFTVTISPTTYEYDGTAKKPTITVKYNEESLNENTDYTISYANNVNAGNGTVSVVGMGNYAGTIEKTFEITKKAITVTPNANQSKIFGEKDSALIYTSTGSLEGQTPKFEGELSRATGEAVGLYTITLGTLTLKDNGTFLANNYKLEFTSDVNFEIKENANSFVTEWTIPANADSDGSGTTIKLPIPENTSNSYMVDWGDGTVEKYTSEAFPSHEYTNTLEETYTIKISGVVRIFGYYGDKMPEATGDNSNYYTFTQNLTKLVNWGEISAYKYAFAYCTKLSGTIPSPTENSFVNVYSMARLFSGCSGLTGNIPEDLFTNAVKADDFVFAFKDCTGLVGRIPSGLFNDAIAAKTMYGVFMNCTGLEGAIPENLFSKNILVEDFGYVFSGATGLTEIPANLFEKNEAATTFEHAFNGCSGLECEIPATLFAKNKIATNFGHTFYNCTGLTGSIPKDLFATCTSAKDFQWTFYNCSGLSGEIPAGFFANRTAVGSFAGVFFGCSGLEGSIPADLFEGCTNVTNYQHVFYQCRNLTGTIPAELFVDSPKATNFNYSFYQCSSLKGGELRIATTDTFTSIGMFNGCKELETLILGEDFKHISSKNMLNGCEKLNSIIMLNDAESSSDVAVLGDLTTIAMPSQTIIYVPTSEAETQYETAWSGIIDATRVEPMLQLLGNKNVEITAGETYTDEGYLVAGYGVNNKADYEQYGYSVTVSDGETTDNLGSFVRTYTLKRTVDGITNTIDTEERTIKIQRIDLSKATGTLTPTKYEYDGKAKEPATTIVLNEKTLERDTDYAVTYKDNTNLGTATATITGIGKYMGTIELTFEIVDTGKPTNPVIDARVNTYSGEVYTSGKAINKNVVIELTSTDTNGIKAYEWSTNPDSGFKTEGITMVSEKGRIAFETEINQEIYFRAQDKADNYGEVSSIVIRIDKTAPTGSINIRHIFEKDGYKYTNSNNVTMDVTAEDNMSELTNLKVALINEDTYANMGANYTITWLDCEAVKSWDTSAGDGLKKVYVIFKDEAGNQSVLIAN